MPPVSIEQVVPITTEDRSGFRVEVGVRTSRLGVDNDIAAGSKVEVTLSSKKPGCADITREQPVAGGGALTVVAGLELPPACRHLWSPKGLRHAGQGRARVAEKGGPSTPAQKCF